MKFWTRLLITIAIMNTFLVFAMPVMFAGHEVRGDQLNGWFEFDTGQNWTQPGTAPEDQNYSQVIKTEALGVGSIEASILTLPNMLIDFVKAIGDFINAPVTFMTELMFPGVFVALFGVAYYTALVIGLATMIPGRDA